MNKVPVQCRNIHLAYGAAEVLRDVSLDIEPGEFFALLGPSGSGKSTLLRLIAGFNRQQRGQVLIDGQDVGAKPPWQRDVGMVFQSYALWPHMTVWDNVAFGLVERRIDKAAIRARVGDVLELVGLSAHAQRRPGQLSGGQQQRVALARTIVVEPKVLLLDEPLSNLDKTLRVQMRQELRAMQRRLGLTTLFVTHDQEEAMTTADRMAVLDGGVVQQVGTPATLYDDPVNPFVAGFVGTMNLLAGTVRGRGAGLLTVEVEGVGELRLPLRAEALQEPTGSHVQVDSNVQVSVRPHCLHIVPANAERDPRHVWMSGTVESSEFLGGSTRYRVRVGGQSVAVDQPHRAGQPIVEPGGRVALGIEPAQVRVFGA